MGITKQENNAHAAAKTCEKAVIPHILPVRNKARSWNDSGMPVGLWAALPCMQTAYCMTTNAKSQTLSLHVCITFCVAARTAGWTQLLLVAASLLSSVGTVAGNALQ